MRSLQRVPVSYRAALQLADNFAGELRCVTRDLHGGGALLHVTGGVPVQVQVGSQGRVRIEIASDESVEFDVDIRHVGAFRLGVRFSE